MADEAGAAATGIDGAPDAPAPVVVAGNDPAPVAGDDTAPGANDTAPGAATEITYDLKIDEGVPVEQATLDAFTAIAKEHNLSPDTAQALVDFQSKMVKDQIAAHTAQQGEWLAQMKADPEIGGDKFNDTVATAVKAFNQFGGPDLKDYLEQTGLGNFPPLVKAFAAIGRAISDDTYVPGRGAAPEVDRARRMYPTMTQ